jgi:hypothetical protein
MSTATPGTLQDTQTPKGPLRRKEIVTDDSGFYLIASLIAFIVMALVVGSIYTDHFNSTKNLPARSNGEVRS